MSWGSYSRRVDHVAKCAKLVFDITGWNANLCGLLCDKFLKSNKFCSRRVYYSLKEQYKARPAFNKHALICLMDIINSKQPTRAWKRILKKRDQILERMCATPGPDPEPSALPQSPLLAHTCPPIPLIPNQHPPELQTLPQTTVPSTECTQVPASSSYAQWRFQRRRLDHGFMHPLDNGYYDTLAKLYDLAQARLSIETLKFIHRPVYPPRARIDIEQFAKQMALARMHN